MLLNLAENASKYNRPDGRITIAAQATPIRSRSKLQTPARASARKIFRTCSRDFTAATVIKVQAVRAWDSASRKPSPRRMAVKSPSITRRPWTLFRVNLPQSSRFEGHQRFLQAGNGRKALGRVISRPLLILDGTPSAALPQTHEPCFFPSAPR